MSNSGYHLRITIQIDSSSSRSRWEATHRSLSAKATQQQKQRKKVNIEKLLDKVKNLNDGVIDPDLEIMVRRRAHQHRNRVWATVETLEKHFKPCSLPNCPFFVNQKRDLIYSAIDGCLKESNKKNTTKRSNHQQVGRKSANSGRGGITEHLQLNLL